MLTIKNISKIYKTNDGEALALSDVGFELPSKGIVCITGKSGSGKSTLLNILAGNDYPTSGCMELNNQIINKINVDAYRTNNIGVVFQDFKLISSLTVSENIRLASELGGKKQCNVDELLELVDMHGHEGRLANELSAGQTQRISIARAMAKGARILLADEPTGNLDKVNAEQIFNLLKSLSANLLVVVVTHDIDRAKVYADKVIELENGVINNKISTESNNEEAISSSNCVQNDNQFSHASKNVGKLSGKTRLSMCRWVYNRIGAKTVIFSLISVLMLVITIAASGFFSASYEQSLNRSLANSDDFLVVSKQNLMLNKHDINIIEKQAGQKLDKGIALSGTQTIELYNPSISEEENYKIFQNLYYYNKIFLRHAVSVGDSSKYKIVAGRMPSESWEICLPSIYAESIIAYGSYPVQEERLLGLPPTQYTAEDVVAVDKIGGIIGKELLLSKNQKDTKFIIVGFFQSSTEEYDWLKNINAINEYSEKDKLKIENYATALDEIQQNYMGLVTDETLDLLIQQSIFGSGSAVSQRYELTYGGSSYYFKQQIDNGSIEYLYGKSADNALQYDIVIPRQMAIDNNIELGSNIFINLQYSNIVERYSVTVVGLHDSDMLVSKELFDSLFAGDNNRAYSRFVFPNFADKRYKAFEKYIIDNAAFDYRSLSFSTTKSHGFEEVTNTFEDIRLYIFLPLILIAFALAVVFVSSLISELVSAKANDIGVLRSLGMRKSEVYKVFLISISWQLLIEFILSLILSGLLFLAINSVLKKFLFIMVDVLFMNGLTIAVAVFAILAIVPLGILLPIWKRNRKTPQKLMKQ